MYTRNIGKKHPCHKEDRIISKITLNYEHKFDIIVQKKIMNKEQIEIWILKNKDMKIYSLENDFFVFFGLFD